MRKRGKKGPMQALAESVRLQAEADRPAGQDLVYDLRSKDGDARDYCADVGRFSDEVLGGIELRAAKALDGYSHHVQEFLRELPRSRGEYAIELLLLGLALRRYGSTAESTPRWAVVLTRELFWLRRSATWIRRGARLARTAITRFVLAPRIGRKTETRQLSLDGLPRLIGWLQATGEFEQETMRLNNWRSFLQTLPRNEAEYWIETAAELFDWFKSEADKALGAYTRGVSSFLAGEHPQRGCREDQIFCGKEAAVYHLDMIAGEIMNRGLREEFERTQRRAVLVPTCMRGTHAATCRAHGFGHDITCTGCDPSCTVSRITRRMRVLGATVYLIPHLRGFSQWLERRQRTPEFGVTAAACLLNILPGGFEVRASGIAAQCVPLDYPGCQNHWHRNGLATSLNEELLVQIVSSRARA